MIGDLNENGSAMKIWSHLYVGHLVLDSFSFQTFVIYNVVVECKVTTKLLTELGN